MTAQLADGQILAAILQILDHDSKPHILFDAPAISLDQIATSLQVPASALDSEHAVSLIEPLAETLFDIPRQPEVELLRKGLSQEPWIVFYPRAYSTANGNERSPPTLLGLPLPTTSSRPYNARAATAATPNPLSRSKSRPQTPVLPRPPLRRVRSERSLVPSPASQLEPLPTSKDLRLVPDLPGGADHGRYNPRSAKDEGKRTPRRGLFKALGLGRRKEHLTASNMAYSHTVDSPLTTRSRRPLGTHRHNSQPSSPDNLYYANNGHDRDAAVGQVHVYPTANEPSYLAPPGLVGTMAGQKGDHEVDDDDASFEIISAYGDDDKEEDRMDVQREVLGMRSDGNEEEQERRIRAALESNRESAGDHADDHAYDSAPKQPAEKSHVGHEGGLVERKAKEVSTSRKSTRTYDIQREDGRRADEDDRKYARTREYRSKGATAEVVPGKKPRSSGGSAGSEREDHDRHRTEEENKDERHHSTRDHKPETKSEDWGKEGQRQRARKGDLRSAVKNSSRSRSRSEGQSSEAHRSKGKGKDVEAEDKDRPPTPWLAVAFDGLPFGPDPNTVSTWNRERWKIVAAELIGVLGLVYILQATGF